MSTPRGAPGLAYGVASAGRVQRLVGLLSLASLRGRAVVMTSARRSEQRDLSLDSTASCAGDAFCKDKRLA